MNTPQKKLLPLLEAAEVLGVGTNKFRELLRDHSDFAERAVVVLGSRCTRYRRSVVEEFAETVTTRAA